MIRPMDKSSIVIRAASETDWHDAMQLAWKTFLQFEAKDYSPEGIRSFSDFVTDPILHQMFLNGDYPMFVAVDGTRVVGMISLRSHTHISLLFVDESYHRQGVGSALIEKICFFLKWRKLEDHVTVNAAPYGVGFYHKMGFKDTDEELILSGIRYTPMERRLL